MNPNDPADAVARALDLLPPDDPAACDPRLLRNPDLAREARHARETVAQTWLAASPLRTAPLDLLPAILEQVSGPRASAPPPPPRRLIYLFAASGWAAAAAVVIWLWPRQPAPVGNEGNTALRQADPTVATQPHDPPHPVSRSREQRQREEIVRLRARLAAFSGNDPTLTPKIITLTAPGSPPRDPEEIRQRVHAILANALRAAIEAETGASNDPAAWVIERGWPGNGAVAPPDGRFIRHRNFPETSWSELGLLRSETGAYYDPATQTVWAPDPAGAGFIGRPLGADEDVSGFTSQGEAIAQTSPAKLLPEGFVIENPADGTADLILGNIPPQPPDTVRTLVVNHESGGIHQSVSLAIPQANSPDTSLTLGSFNTLNSFQIIETSLTPNGQPPRVIVGSTP